MRILSKYSAAKVAPDATRLKRVFAFYPVLVAGYWLWLETYEVLQANAVTPYKLIVEGKERAFIIERWIDIDKRIVVRNVQRVLWFEILLLLCGALVIIDLLRIFIFSA